MKPARVAVLGIAVGAGLIAAFIALKLSAPAPAPEVATKTAVDATQVLVASVDIPVGTTMKSDAVKWSDWPSSGISDKFIVRSGTTDQIAPVVGAIARASFYAGEPISQAKLIRSDQGYMSAILPAGMLAVATKTSAETSAGGFILPNDRVDVIMSRRADNASPDTSGGTPFLTETVLNNVRVLAIDQTIEDQNGQKVVVGQTATLELTSKQAQILTVAQQMSDHLTLALRSIADAKAPIGDNPNDAVDLIGGTKRNGAVTIVRNGVASDVTGIR